jgi:hypothetical protein
MVQDISRWPDKADASLRSKLIPSEIYGEKIGTEAGVSASSAVSPVSIIPPMLHTHSNITTIKFN